MNYFSGYIQDDYRVTNRLTVNYGIRLEHETGLAERDNQLAVGFDTTTPSPLNVTIPAGLDPLHPQARQVKGGLIYAGVNGAPTHQGNPPAIKPSPRAGVVFKIDDETVLRGGYGMFWAPWNYSAVTSTGYSQTTSLTQNNNDADHDDRQPVSERPASADRQQPWTGVRREHRRQLLRSERLRAARPAGTRRTFSASSGAT